MKRRWLWLLAAVLIVLPLFGPEGVGVSAQDEGTPVVTETPTDVPTEVPTETPTEVLTSTPAETPSETVTPVETGTATPTPTATGTPTGTRADVVITLSCATDPELTRIENVGAYPFTITWLSSFDSQSGNGTFWLNRVLAPGQSVTYQSGSAARENILTKNELYLSGNATDHGLSLTTSLGGVSQRCPTLSTPTATPTPQGSAADLVIKLSCYANPEQTRIDNIGAYPITIYEIRPRSNLQNQPVYTVNRTLGAGRTVIYRSDTAATSGTVLTTDELYSNTSWTIGGVTLRTSVGFVTQDCPPWPVPAVKLRVTVSCITNPETIRIENIGTTDATIATIVAVLTNKSVTVSRVLGAGQTVIYRSGSKATSGTVLTTQEMFRNSGYTNEGVQIITTSRQIFTDMCDPKLPATPTPTPSPTPTAYPSLLQVSVNCKGTPETVTVKNVGKGTVTITTVGSLYQPLSGEPYRVNRTLKPGQSITFQSGSGAVTNRLTALYIFNNNVGSTEGVRVVVSTGKTFTTRCS